MSIPNIQVRLMTHLMIQRAQCLEILVAASLTSLIHLLSLNDTFPQKIISINTADEHTKQTLTVEIWINMIYVRATGTPP